MNSLGILGAVLGGFGGIGAGYGAAEKLAIARDEEQRRAAADALRNELLREQMRQSQSQFDSTQAWQREKFEAEQAAAAQTRQESQAQKLMEMLGVARAREAVANMGARADAPMPAEGAMYSEADTLPGKAVTPKNQILASLIGVPGANAIIEGLYPERKEPAQPNATAQAAAMAAELSTRLDAGETQENSPEVRRLVAQLNVVRNMTATQPGGSVYGAGDLIGYRQGPQQAAGAPGGGANGPTPRITTPGVPSPGERKELADLDGRIAAFTQLAHAAQSPEIAPMLGVGKGTLNRLGEDWLKLDRLTPEQRNFRATLAIELTQARTIMFGLAQTQRELAGLAPALPTENDPDMAPKLMAWAQWAERNRAQIEGGLRQYNIRPRDNAGQAAPTAQATPAAPTGPYNDEGKYTGIVTQPDMPQGPAGRGKIWIQAPDGVWGKWDASQPIPPGYRR